MTPFITVRLGLGNGAFGPARTFALPDPVPTSGIPPGLGLPSAQDSRLFSLEAADFDGDGNLDLTAGFWDCRLGFFRGHGDGTFSFTQAHVLFAEPRAMTAGDFDGDGDLDVACASIYAKIAIIANDGDLLTTKTLRKTIMETEIGNVWSMKAYEANNDNDLDLLVAGERMLLLLGQPGLAFASATNQVSLPGEGSTTIATADFNADGIIDMATAASQSGTVSVLLGTPAGDFRLEVSANVPASRFLAAGDVDGDGLPDLIGTGEALWVALSGSRLAVKPPPLLPEARSVARHLVVNELLAVNTGLPLDADGGRNSDWVELFNGSTNTLSLAGWQLLLIHTNLPDLELAEELSRTNTIPGTNWVAITNDFTFAGGITIPPGGRQLVVFSDKIRSANHTGFKLSGSGGTLCLFDAQRREVDRVDYPPQQANISYSRFRDGMPSFMACNFPTPGAANTDSGPVAPQLSFLGVAAGTLAPSQPIQLFARSTDDVGVMGVVVKWRRLDLANSPTNRVILGDDGMSGDGALLDGVYSGAIPPLPAGAEIEFYLESTDISELTVTEPGNPAFAAPGQPSGLYTLAVGAAVPSLEISEIVARNAGGLRDENLRSPDWIEIRNTSTNPVSLAGVQLSQRFFGNSERLTFSNGFTLGPGQHLVVFADNDAGLGQLHAPFKVNRDGDELFLTMPTSNGGRALIDNVAFGPQGENVAWARLGRGGIWRTTEPTPRAANLPRGWAITETDGLMLFGFAPPAGSKYKVEFAPDLESGLWFTIDSGVGTGVEQTATRPRGKQGFFRVRPE
jgi:hypothetical protein